MTSNARGAGKIRIIIAIAHRGIALIALVLLAVGMYWSIRLAEADWLFRQNTPESVRAAVALDSGNAAFHEILAEHLEGELSDPQPELKSAVLLDPFNSPYWIRLSIQNEVAGDLSDAEKDVLEGARVDRLFAPRWAVANYYFRRNDPRFWPWAAAALQTSVGDPTPVFRLCWSMTQDAARIGSILPARMDVRNAYLEYLLYTGHPEAAVPVAEKSAADGGRSDLPTLLHYCNRLIDKNTASVLKVWNILCRRRLLPFEALSPEKGAVVTNGDFSIPFLQLGFDWRLSQTDGVDVRRVNPADGLSIALSGSEPEDCTLLYQTIPLSPGRAYKVTYEYLSPGSGAISGLKWRLGDFQSEDLTHSDAWTSGAFKFEAGSKQGARLELHYRRALGTVRWEGSLSLRRVAIELARCGYFRRPPFGR